jgi:GNAT superfamily N-acetyltransferase
MPLDEISTFTLARRPDLEDEVRSMSRDVLPEFAHHDSGAGRHWDRLFTDFADLQVAVTDENGVIAAGNSVPLFWNSLVEGLPDDIGGILERAVMDLQNDHAPNTASALLAMVDPGQQGRGLSVVVLQAMKRAAADRGFRALIAPVRPTLKHRYPLTPMDRYIRWIRPDGLPFDPWLRVHARLGAEFLKISPQAMTIAGNISE